MKLEKIDYKDLNKKSKEAYNFHKIAAILADYGYNCIWLPNDWNGADFIAVHVDGLSDVKIQQKGGISLDRKYLGKNLYIGFIEQNDLYIYPHDHVMVLIESSLSNDQKWLREGTYFQTKIPKKYKEIFDSYKIPK